MEENGRALVQDLGPCLCYIPLWLVRSRLGAGVHDACVACANFLDLLSTTSRALVLRLKKWKFALYLERY